MIWIVLAISIPFLFVIGTIYSAIKEQHRLENGELKRVLDERQRQRMESYQRKSMQKLDSSDAKSANEEELLSQDLQDKKETQDVQDTHNAHVSQSFADGNATSKVSPIESDTLTETFAKNDKLLSDIFNDDLIDKMQRSLKKPSLKGRGQDKGKR